MSHRIALKKEGNRIPCLWNVKMRAMLPLKFIFYINSLQFFLFFIFYFFALLLLDFRVLSNWHPLSKKWKIYTQTYTHISLHAYKFNILLRQYKIYEKVNIKLDCTCDAQNMMIYARRYVKNIPVCNHDTFIRWIVWGRVAQ
jgi:hypothetical protein